MLDEGTTTAGFDRDRRSQGAAGRDRSARAPASIAPMCRCRRRAPTSRPSLDLLADIVRNPAFEAAEVARLKNQQLAQIAAGADQSRARSPAGCCRRSSTARSRPTPNPRAPAIPKAVAALTRDDLVAFQHAWLRPDKAKIFVVSDRPLAEVKAALDARFGDWKGVGAAGHQELRRGLRRVRAQDHADRSPGFAAVADPRRHPDRVEGHDGHARRC